MEEQSAATAETALDENEFYEREELKEENLHVIVFRLGCEWYGLEITTVREIIKAGKITYLPSSPKHITGIVNFRGNILSVTDLKTFFNLAHEEQTEKARIIVVESKTAETGFLADEVVESVEVPLSKIEETLPTISAEGIKYLKGHFRLDDRLIALINVEKALEKAT